MKPETEQLLGTLEVLIGNTFVWETEIQGEFNVWNLAIAQGFVSLTDVDEAITHWQAVESWGTPTDQSKNDYEYAPKRNERKDGWNAEIEAKRFELYQQLLQLFQAEFQELQAFRLSASHKKNEYFEWHHPSFCFYIIIGKTNDDNWFCFSPTVPDQVTYHPAKQSNSELAEVTDTELANALILNLQSRINNIILELPPITLYGYYDGGYKYKYKHQIVYSIATKKSVAIELALQAAQMLRMEKTNVEYAPEDFNNQKLSQFLNSQLSDRTIYTLSFWDIGYTYNIGKTPTGDWLGVKTQLEFEYNP